jgi:hypothetical protein
MKKFIAGLIAGICLVALTLIAVVIPPETFLQTKWKIISSSLGFCAAVFMVLQGLWTKEDEDAQRKAYAAETTERRRFLEFFSALLNMVVLKSGSTEAIEYAKAIIQHLSSTPATEGAEPSAVILHVAPPGEAQFVVPTQREQALNELEQITMKALG